MSYSTGTRSSWTIWQLINIFCSHRGKIRALDKHTNCLRTHFILCFNNSKRVLWNSTNPTFQKWRINGSELYVTDSEQSIAKRSSNITNNEIEIRTASNIKRKTTSEKPYQLYRRNANSFWADIPHQASRMRTKKAQVKFNAGFTKRTNMFCMCQNKRKTERRNSKKTNVKQHLFSHCYNSMKLVRQIIFLGLLSISVDSDPYFTRVLSPILAFFVFN